MDTALRLSLLTAILFAASPAAATPVDTASVGVEFSIVPKPEAFYSPARGFGVGADVTLRHLGWAGSLLHLSATTMTRHGEYSAFLFSADPRDASLLGGLGLHYVGTRAYTFYGLGPWSRHGDAVRLSARRIEGEVRVAWRPIISMPLTVQPALRLLHARMRGFEEVEAGALARLDRPSVASLDRAVAAPSTGLSVGITMILDLFDEVRHPRSGALLSLSGRRYAGLDADPFGFWQSTALAHGVVPIAGRRTVIESRALLTVTRPVGDDEPIPFFALPTFGGEVVAGYPRYRMVGRDALALNLGLRVPILDILDWVGAEGSIAFHLANAYDDVFSQFAPRVSFARDLPRDNGAAPLRPGLTLGGYLMDLGTGLPIVSGQIGLSPEGLQLAGLDFVIDLRTRRPPVR